MASSSYQVKQGNIFGRIGSGVGQGLAEQVPKEIERSRLASGLQQFEQDSANLSPMQQLARLSAIPGITPQMIQSFTELGKQQGLRSSLKQGRNQPQGQPAQDPRITAALEKINTGSQAKSSRIDIPENVPREAVGQEQIVPGNPLRPEVKTFRPPTDDEYRDKLGDIWDRNPGLTFDQAKQETNDYFQRQANLTEAERAEDIRQENVQQAVNKKFDDQLETKLQKAGPEIFKDLTGEMKVNLQRGLQRDIAKGDISIDDAVNKWTNKALDLAKTKSQLYKLGKGQGALTSFFKQGETLDKLKSYQKTFKDADNLEEFFNILKGEFGMSPHAAAQIAYPRSDSVNKVIKGIKDIDYFSQIKDSKKAAINIEDALTREDSLLAIAKNLADVYENFNQRAFFQQLVEDRDRLSLSPQQKRELDEGVSDWLPNWNDTWFFPNTRGLNK